LKDRPLHIGRYYPSFLTDCLLKQWIMYKNPSLVPPKKTRAMMLGSMYDDIVYEAIRSLPEEEAEKIGLKLIAVEKLVELKIAEDAVIAGRCDAVIELEGRKYVMEIKNTKTLDRQGRFFMIYPGWILQLNLYMHMLGIRQGILYVFTREKLDRHIFRVPYSRRLAEVMIGRALQLHGSLKSDIPPPPEPSKRCDWCYYKIKSICMNLRMQKPLSAYGEAGIIYSMLE